MFRNAIQIPTEDIVNEYNLDIRYIPKNCNVQIYIDEENFNDILQIIEKFAKKARSAFYYIINCRYNNDIYGKEKIDKKTTSITAIKFKAKHGENFRIYCKEFYENNNIFNKKVVLITVYQKKTQKIDKKLHQLIKKISDYEYKFKQE